MSESESLVCSFLFEDVSLATLLVLLSALTIACAFGS